MKYAKIRKSVLQESLDGGLTWNDVEGTEEEVMVKTFTSSTACENSPIGTIPSVENGVMAVALHSDGTLDYYQCDTGNTFYGLTGNTFDEATGNNKSTVISLSIGSCAENVMGACHTTTCKGDGLRGAVALRNLQFSNSTTSITDNLSDYYTSGLYNYNIVNLQLPSNIVNTNFGLWNTRIHEVVVPQTSTNTGTWYRASPYIKNIVLKNRPSEIRDYFATGTKITSFDIPDSVTSIGAYAFSGCTSLTSVTIPNSVTAIGEGAFYQCTNLNLTSFPDSVVSIGNYAIWGANNTITSFTFSNNVTTVGSMFNQCPYLKWIDFGTSLNTLTGNIGSGNLEYVIFRTQNPPVGLSASSFGSSETYFPIYVPDESVITWKLALSSTGNLKYRIRPLSSMSNPTSTTYRWIDDGYTCVNYDKWQVQKKQYSTNGGTTWYDTGDVSATTLIERYSTDCGYTSANTKFIGVYTGGTDYRVDCDGNTTLTYTNTNAEYVKNSLAQGIIGSCVSTIGRSAFSGCSQMSSIEIPSGVTNILGHAFRNCGSLRSITIPSGVTSVGDYAFNGCGITSIELPSGITSIGYRCFQWCSNLTSVVVKAATPPTLGSQAFDNTSCTIYVLATSLEDYKVASGWSDYASRIQAIT